MRPIVFLHIPKTAGQTIHHALAAMVGHDKVSPFRVNEQTGGGTALPPGYVLHSGHLDWTDLETLGDDPFVFTVLRDPRERVGSFYFYLLDTAFKAGPEELERRHGLRRIMACSADEYFFGGDAKWQLFVQNMYFNFYCSYFATRRVRGRAQLSGLCPEEVVARALDGSAPIQKIYRTSALGALEDDIERLYGHRIRVAGHYLNTGNHAGDEGRWQKLLARMERDDSVRKLQAFVAEDEDLMDRLAAAGRLL